MFHLYFSIYLLILDRKLNLIFQTFLISFVGFVDDKYGLNVGENRPANYSNYLFNII